MSNPQKLTDSSLSSGRAVSCGALESNLEFLVVVQLVKTEKLNERTFDFRSANCET